MVETRGRWLGVAASLSWILAVALLASRDETWTAAFRLHCYLTADTTCAGTTVFLVVHWPVIAAVMIVPVIFGWLLAWGLLAVRRRTAP
jgi:uncharacterized membrane protein required for colicin V production